MLYKNIITRARFKLCFCCCSQTVCLSVHLLVFSSKLVILGYEIVKNCAESVEVRTVSLLHLRLEIVKMIKIELKDVQIVNEAEKDLFLSL